MSDAAAFSFNFFKAISSGEGGIVVTRHRAAYERARIYHDIGTAFFGNQKFNREREAELFVGVNYRIDELRAAVLRVQLRRLPGISANLRKRWKDLRARLSGSPYFEPISLHEIDGNCGSALLVRFASEASARGFLKDARDTLSVVYPYESGPHVYSNWEPLMKRRGAYHPDWDPLHVTEAGRAQAYAPNMLPKTLNHLKRTVGIEIDPNWSDEDVEGVAQKFIDIAASAPGVVGGSSLSSARAQIHVNRARFSRNGANLLRSVIPRQLRARVRAAGQFLFGEEDNPN